MTTGAIRSGSVISPEVSSLVRGEEAGNTDDNSSDDLIGRTQQAVSRAGYSPPKPCIRRRTATASSARMENSQISFIASRTHHLLWREVKDFTSRAIRLADRGDNIAVITIRRAFHDRVLKLLERIAGTSDGEEECGCQNELFHNIRVLKRTVHFRDIH